MPPTIPKTVLQRVPRTQSFKAEKTPNARTGKGPELASWRQELEIEAIIEAKVAQALRILAP